MEEEVDTVVEEEEVSHFIFPYRCLGQALTTTSF